jgi:hypothetical protein
MFYNKPILGPPKTNNRKRGTGKAKGGRIGDALLTRKFFPATKRQI